MIELLSEMLVEYHKNDLKRIRRSCDTHTIVIYEVVNKHNETFIRIDTFPRNNILLFK